MAVKELTDYLEGEAAKVRVSFSRDKDKLKDYLRKYQLKDYFSKDVQEEERARLESSLEAKLGSNMKKFDTELGGIARKSVSKGSMGLVILNDLYTFLSDNPIRNATAFAYAFFVIKTAAEIPALRRYWRKTHDWYGAADLAKYMLMKPVRYLIPVVGAALESGALERMAIKRVIYDTQQDFIKEHGDYVSFEEKLKEKLKQPVYASIDREEEQEEPSTVNIGAFRAKEKSKAA